MKDIAVFLVVLLFSFPVEMQAQHSHSRSLYGSQIMFHGAVGVSAGQENFIGAPKLGGYMDFSLHEKKSPKFGFHTFSAYAGAEVSLFVFFAGTFSASAMCGVKAGPVTLDNSVSAATAVDSDGETTYSWRTWNPKLGLMIGPVWLKAGPSYVIGGKVEMGNWMKVHGTHFNADLLYIFPHG